VSYQVLARRWRPLTFDAVVGQGPIVRTLQNALARDRIAHAYLFAGPRGVGKTTMARLLAMGLGCEGAGTPGPVPCAACGPCREVIGGRAFDVIEIDGASNRGIDEVRALRENARYAPARGRRKVYIIDEVHMLTEPAFNALLKTLEEPPAHVVFVLATTEPRRLPATVLSRCQRFDFRPISAGEIRAGLQRILDEERGERADAAVEPEALAVVAAAADGSLRDALSLLDTALAYGQGAVTARAVRELLGSAGAEAAWELAAALVRRDAPAALGQIGTTASEGLDLALLCQDAMEVLRRALLRGVGAGGSPEGAPDEAERVTRLGHVGPEDLLLLVRGLLDAEAEMRRSPHPRVDLEVAVVRLCHRPEPQAIETVLERLERAEAHLRGYGPAEPAAPVQGDLLDAPPDPRSSSASAAGPGSGAPRPASRGGPARGGGVPAVSGAASSAPMAPGSTAATPTAVASPPPAARDLDAAWRQIVTEVTRVRPTLGHLLAGAVVVSNEGGRLTVALPNGNAFTQDQVRNRANRELLIEAAQRIWPGIEDVVVAGAPPAGSPGADALSHPAVQATIELFDGEVTAVRPAGPRGRVEPREAPAESGGGDGS
jgi:DNA polymerase-3 subunit gamma/tau